MVFGPKIFVILYMSYKIEWGRIEKQRADFLDKVLILLDGYYWWIIQVYSEKEQQVG